MFSKLYVFFNSESTLSSWSSLDETMQPTRGNFRSWCWKVVIGWCEATCQEFRSRKVWRTHRSTPTLICSHTMIIIGVATCPRKCNTRGSRTSKNFDFQPTLRQLLTQLQFKLVQIFHWKGLVSKHCERSELRLFQNWKNVGVMFV